MREIEGRREMEGGEGGGEVTYVSGLTTYSGHGGDASKSSGKPILRFFFLSFWGLFVTYFNRSVHLFMK